MLHIKPRLKPFFRSRSLSLCLLCLFSVQSQAALPENLSNYIQDLETQANELTGCAVAIIYKGNLVYKKVLGNNTFTPNTLFALASVSKPITTTAIAIEVENGNLDLQKKYYLPCLRNPVTLTNLLNHSTGYDNFQGNKKIEAGLSRKAILLDLQKTYPTHEPGESFEYSNVLFSLIQEALSANVFQKLVSNLKIKLSIPNLFISSVPKSADFARPYYKANKTSPLKPIRSSSYPSRVPAAAGIYGSLNSMIEILRLNLGCYPEILSKSTLQIFQSPTIRTPNRWKAVQWPLPKENFSHHYGLGWRIVEVKDQKNLRFVYHGGFTNGVHTFIGLLPGENSGIVCLSNQTTHLPYKSGFKFWTLFFEK